MAAQLPMQDYIYASEIAYNGNPRDDLLKFLPSYKLLGFQTLQNGFQGMALQGTDGHVLVAFRGTLPDLKGTLNHFAAVYGDGLMFQPGVIPTQQQLDQYTADQQAWQGDALVNDLTADIEISKGKAVEQFASGLAFMRQYMPQAGSAPVYVTGHSLGGGIADFVAGAIPGITGTTFAAPGYIGYGNASAANMLNYYNVNDTVPTVNLQYHCGPVKPLDILHSSFAVEHQLGLRSDIIEGFNGTPDVSTALTAHGDRAASIVASSLGFLIARRIFHELPNYAGLLGQKSITGKTTKHTLAEFADAARFFIQNLRLARRRGDYIVNTPQRIGNFTISVAKRGEQVFIDVLTAAGKAEIAAGPYGYIGP